MSQAWTQPPPAEPNKYNAKIIVYLEKGFLKFRCIYTNLMCLQAHILKHIQVNDEGYKLKIKTTPNTSLSLISVEEVIVSVAWMKSRMSIVAPGRGNEKKRGPQFRTSTFIVS